MALRCSTETCLPLRHERLSLYRFTLPEATAEDQDRWKVSVDLGVVARTYALNEFDATAWLDSPQAGLGERFDPIREGDISTPRLRRAVQLRSPCTTSGRENDTSLSSMRRSGSRTGSAANRGSSRDSRS